MVGSNAGEAGIDLTWSRLNRRQSRRRMAQLLDDPGAMLRSIRLSREIGGRAFDFPVVAGPTAQIVQHESSRIELGGHLFLGFAPDDSGRRKRTLPTSRRARLVLGGEARFTTNGWVVMADGVQIGIRKAATVEVGEGSYFNTDARVVARRSVTIGAGCAIAGEALILDTDEHALVVGDHAGRSTAPVVLEDRVWIGTRALVLKGVHIGEGAVVAAQSVVTRDVPARSVVAGSPARVVRTDISWW